MQPQMNQYHHIQGSSFIQPPIIHITHSDLISCQNNDHQKINSSTVNYLQLPTQQYNIYLSTINSPRTKKKNYSYSAYHQKINSQIQPPKPLNSSNSSKQSCCSSIEKIITQTKNYVKSQFYESYQDRQNRQEFVSHLNIKKFLSHSARFDSCASDKNALNESNYNSDNGLKIPSDQSFMFEGSQVSQKSSVITVVKVIKINSPIPSHLIEQQWFTDSFIIPQNQLLKPQINRNQNRKQNSTSSNMFIQKQQLKSNKQILQSSDINNQSSQIQFFSKIVKPEKNELQYELQQNINIQRNQKNISALQFQKQQIYLNSIKQNKNQQLKKIKFKQIQKEKQPEIVPIKKLKQQMSFCLQQQCASKPIYSQSIDSQVQQHQYHPKIDYKEIQKYFQNFKANFHLSKKNPNIFQSIKNNLLDVVLNLRQLEFKITNDLKYLRLQAQKHIKMVILSFGERVYEERINKLRNDQIIEQKFIRTCLDQLQSYSKVKYLNINFPVNASLKIKSQLIRAIQPFQLQWNRCFQRFKKRLLIQKSLLGDSKINPQQSYKEVPFQIYKQLHSLNTFLYPRTSEIFKFSHYFKSDHYQLSDKGHKLFKPKNQLNQKNNLNKLTPICLIQKRFDSGSQITFQIGNLTGMIGIGLIDLTKAIQARFTNCIKYGVFMDNFARLIPTKLQQNIKARFSGLEIKRGQKIKMGRTKDNELYFKKGGFFNRSSLVKLKAIFGQNLLNLYPCVYIRNPGTQIKIIKQ